MTFILYSVLIAVVAWIVTHEEVFVELRIWANHHYATLQERDAWLRAKAFYPLGCHVCFSFYVTLATLLTFHYHPFGYVLTFASLWASANVLMTMYESRRVRIAETRARAEVHEQMRKQLWNKNNMRAYRQFQAQLGRDLNSRTLARTKR